MSDDCIQVLIVDDHEFVRSSLSIAFEQYDSLCVVGEAATAAEALELCVALQPDAVLLDFILPDLDGMTAVARIKAHLPTAQIIVLSAENYYQEAIQAGAAACLLKDNSFDTIARTIEDACHNSRAN
ncbi:MAG: response regulator transcription factor [Chloroflexi bacterium]|jgi:two-component system NarL family response regulator|nr:response regulator transcription factor [Chloroflexota bacterium]